MNLQLDYSNIFFSNLMFYMSLFFITSAFFIRFIAYLWIIPWALFEFNSPKNISPKPPEPIKQLIVKSSHLTFLFGAFKILSIPQMSSITGPFSLVWTVFFSEEARGSLIGLFPGLLPCFDSSIEVIYPELELTPRVCFSLEF